MGSKIDLTGRRYGRLLVLAEGEHRNKRIYWICKCDCGKTKQINGRHLRRGNISSCGCISKEGNHVTHGLSKRNRLYRIRGGIKSRCDNPNVPSYKHYGARGISVCEEWRDYKAFHEWAVSNGYSEELTIDRIDVDGNYCPENCRWISRGEQVNNRRTTKYVTINGIKKPRSEWAKEYGISYWTLRSRHDFGYQGLELLEGKNDSN